MVYFRDPDRPIKVTTARAESKNAIQCCKNIGYGYQLLYSFEKVSKYVTGAFVKVFKR